MALDPATGKRLETWGRWKARPNLRARPTRPAGIALRHGSRGIGLRWSTNGPRASPAPSA